MPSPDIARSRSGDLTSRSQTIVERSDNESEYSHNPENEEIHREQYPEHNKEGQYDPFMVRFEDNDPENPKVCFLTFICANVNLSGSAVELVICQERILDGRCWWFGAQRVSCTINILPRLWPLKDPTSTFASSAPSGIVPQLQKEFGFGEEVATLTIALFVAGYCVGPLLCTVLRLPFLRSTDTPYYQGVHCRNNLVESRFSLGHSLSTLPSKLAARSLRTRPRSSFSDLLVVYLLQLPWQIAGRSNYPCLWL
jgi:hypothetical protein